MLPVVTPRLVAFAAAGAVLAPIGGAAWVLAYDLALAVVAIVDWLRAPHPERIDLRRDIPEVLTVGTTGRVTWTVVNPTSRPLRVALADELDDALGTSTRRVSMVVPPRGRISRSVELQPARRGRFALERITVRATGPLGLAARQRWRVLDGVITVYPPFRSRPAIELRLRRALQLQSGDRSVRLPGAGMDFDSLREYTVDDDVRRIDWAATARSPRAVVRTYRDERNQTVLVLVDCGRTMAALVGGRDATTSTDGDGSTARRDLPAAESAAAAEAAASAAIRTAAAPAAVRTAAAPAAESAAAAGAAASAAIPRLEHAIDAAQGITRMATGLGDRVGMVAFADRVLTALPPRNQADQLRRLTVALSTVDARLVESDFHTAFATALGRFPRRALLVVLSELANEAAVQTLLPALGMVRRRHLVVVGSVRDPLVERWRTEPADSVEEVYRQAAAIRTLDQRAATAARLRAAGATVVDAVPGELATALADAYLDVKAAGRL